MTTESRLNKELDAITESLEQSLPRKNGQVNRAVDRARLTISDVLTKHTDSNGKIPKSKTTQVTSELRAIEGEIYRNLRDELHTVVRDTVGASAPAIATALVTVIGVKALLDFLGEAEEIIGDSVAAIFRLLVGGSDYMEFIDAVDASVFNRKGSDDKRLNDRLRPLAKGLYEDVSATVRQSIQNGETTPAIQRKVTQRFKDVTSRIKRIVETETLYAHRQTVGWIAERSGIANGIKIVDYPHGHGEHVHHKCYIYSKANEHGMGQGVYPVGTRKIRNPHPQCRATLHLVLAGKLNE